MSDDSNGVEVRILNKVAAGRDVARGRPSTALKQLFERREVMACPRSEQLRVLLGPQAYRAFVLRALQPSGWEEGKERPIVRTVRELSRCAQGGRVSNEHVTDAIAEALGRLSDEGVVNLTDKGKWFLRPPVMEAVKRGASRTIDVGGILLPGSDQEAPEGGWLEQYLRTKGIE